MQKTCRFCFRNLFSFCRTSSPTPSISSRSAFGDDNCLPFLIFPLVYFLVSVSLDLLLFGVLSLLWYGPRSFPHSFYSTLPTSSRSPLQLALIRIFASFKHCSCWSSELFLPSNTAPQHSSSDSINPTLPSFRQQSDCCRAKSVFILLFTLPSLGCAVGKFQKILITRPSWPFTCRNLLGVNLLDFSPINFFS